MKKNYAKIGIVLIVSGLVIFGIMLLVLDVERQTYGELGEIPNLLFYNYTALVGIPISLFGVALLIASFVPRFSSPILVGLLSPVLIGMWFLFIFSRSS